MSLDIKSLSRINELNEQLTAVNKEIKNITRMASTASEYVKYNRVITVCVEEQAPTQQINKIHGDDGPMEIVIDGNSGSSPIDQLFRGLSEAMERRGRSGHTTAPEPERQQLKTNISETTTLKLLAILLIEKQEEKSAIVKQLEELGVSIKTT